MGHGRLHQLGVLKKRFGFDHGFAVYDDRMPQPGSAQDSWRTPNAARATP